MFEREQSISYSLNENKNETENIDQTNEKNQFPS